MTKYQDNEEHCIQRSQQRVHSGSKSLPRVHSGFQYEDQDPSTSITATCFYGAQASGSSADGESLAQQQEFSMDDGAGPSGLQKNFENDALVQMDNNSFSLNDSDEEYSFEGFSDIPTQGLRQNHEDEHSQSSQDEDEPFRPKSTLDRRRRLLMDNSDYVDMTKRISVGSPTG